MNPSVQVSKIINTVSDPFECTGCLGFIITYPDGRIENRILEYDKQSYDRVSDRIMQMYADILKQNGLD